MTTVMVWHERTDADAGARAFRQVIADASRMRSAVAPSALMFVGATCWPHCVRTVSVARRRDACGRWTAAGTLRTPSAAEAATRRARRSQHAAWLDEDDSPSVGRPVRVGR